MIKMLFAGYCVMDIIDGKKSIGGAGGVMAINATFLGISSSLVSVLSGDSHGKTYQKVLNKHHIDTSLCSFHSPKLPTCIIDNPFGLGSKRKWADNGANTFFSEIKITIKDLKSFDGIFLANVNPILGEEISKHTDRKLFYIPGPQVVNKKDYIKTSILEKTKIVFGNSEEAKYIFEKKPFSLGVEMVVITKGDTGGSVYLKDTVIDFDPPKIKHVIDPTGAGDSFSLGFGISVLQGKSVFQAIEYGKKLVTKVLSKRGGLLFN